MGYSPRIAPTQVAFATLEGSIYLARGGTPVLLATLSPPPFPPAYYEVNDGWAAFVKPDAGGIGHVFSVAPDGTQRQVSSGAETRIVTVGLAGEVVFARRAGNFWRRYLSVPPYTGQPLDVGEELGEMRFEGTELYAIVGRSVFRVNY